MHLLSIVYSSIIYSLFIYHLKYIHLSSIVYSSIIFCTVHPPIMYSLFIYISFLFICLLYALIIYLLSLLFIHSTYLHAPHPLSKVINYHNNTFSLRSFAENIGWCCGRSSIFLRGSTIPAPPTRQPTRAGIGLCVALTLRMLDLCCLKMYNA